MASLRLPIRKMHVAIILCLFATSIQCSNTSASRSLIQTLTDNTTSPALSPHVFASNTTMFATLAAPLYRNVTAGDAWVFPSSANDLGARDMSCECFNPGDQCCIAQSSSVAPFCMPAGSTCCGDTFCVAGETCCGEFCCAANTTCNINLAIASSGCCPIGALCSGPATCYDYASSNCSDRPTPLQQCCPSNIPFCRNFKPNGLGCYGSSTTASSTSSVQAMTAADTSNLFASSAATSTSTIATHTVIVSVISNGFGGVSIEFPTPGASVGPESEQTTYVIEWPASLATATAVGTTSGSAEGSKTVSSLSTIATTAMNASVSASGSPQAPSAATKSPSPSSSSSSSPVALCYDPNANSHSPCPTTTTTSATSTAAGFSPPGASVVRSQAHKLHIPLVISLRDGCFSFFSTSLQRIGGAHLAERIIVAIVSAISIAYVCLRLLRIWNDDDGPPPFQAVPGPAVVLSNSEILLGLALALALGILPACPQDYSSYVKLSACVLVIVGVCGALEASARMTRSGRREAGERAAVREWLVERCGYSDAQVRTIMAGPADGVRAETHDGLAGGDDGAAMKEEKRKTITVVEGSARPLLEKKVVGKEEISVVEGSGRVLG